MLPVIAHGSAFVARLKNVGVMVATCITVVGCTANLERDESLRSLSPVSVELIEAPAGGVFDAPVWVGSVGRFVVTYTPSGGDPTPAWRNHLYLLGTGSGQFARIDLPARKGCRHTSQDLGRLHPDGRLIYIEECWGNVDPSDAKQLRAYDFRTAESVDMLRYPLPIGANWYAFSPDGKHGLINDGNGLYERLRWMTPKGLEAVAARFQRAGYPSWSPKGRVIAVDAVAPQREGVGIARLDLPRDLYLLDAMGEVQKTLISNVESAGASSWSPDGRWLALPLDPKGGPDGLYIVNARTGEYRLLLEGTQFGGSVWLPDGRTLVVATGLFVQLGDPYRTDDVGLLKIRLPRLD